MDKITFLGAGSTVFAKNVLGDCITTDAMREFEYALYDIDHQRLEESYMMLSILTGTLTTERLRSSNMQTGWMLYVEQNTSLTAFKWEDMTPVRLQTLKFPKNMDCARRSEIRTASVECSGHCAPSL